MGSQNKLKRAEMLKAFSRQRGRCHLCGEPMNQSKDQKDGKRATADHVIPKSMGGPVKGNIKAAHADCNVARGNGPVYQKKENTDGR